MAVDAGSTDQSHKSHRTSQSGASAKKKKGKKKGEVSENDKKQNPKVCNLLDSTVIAFDSRHCILFRAFPNSNIHICMYLCICTHSYRHLLSIHR